ncbi:hypothetical protein DIPPA_12416 [Diplonema papillatum]|nr:hypothetical protein DIPPA_12416 [Diplonema papillatum]
MHVGGGGPSNWRAPQGPCVDRELQYTLSEDESPSRHKRMTRCGSTGLDVMMSLSLPSTASRRQAEPQQGSPISPPMAAAGPPSSTAPSSGKWRMRSFQPEEHLASRVADRESRYTAPDSFSEAASPGHPETSSSQLFFAPGQGGSLDSAGRAAGVARHGGSESGRERAALAHPETSSSQLFFAPGQGGSLASAGRAAGGAWHAGGSEPGRERAALARRRAQAPAAGGDPSGAESVLRGGAAAWTGSGGGSQHQHPQAEAVVPPRRREQVQQPEASGGVRRQRGLGTQRGVLRGHGEADAAEDVRTTQRHRTQTDYGEHHGVEPEAAEDVRRQREQRMQPDYGERYANEEPAPAEDGRRQQGRRTQRDAPRGMGEPYGDDAPDAAEKDTQRQRGHRTQLQGYGEYYGGEEAEPAADARGRLEPRIHGESYGDEAPEAAEEIRRQPGHRTQRQDYEAYYEGEEAEAEAAADARGHLEPRIHGDSYGDEALEATEDIRRQRGHRTQQHDYGEYHGGEEAEYAADAKGHWGRRIHGESYSDEALEAAEGIRRQRGQRDPGEYHAPGETEAESVGEEHRRPRAGAAPAHPRDFFAAERRSRRRPAGEPDADEPGTAAGQGQPRGDSRRESGLDLGGCDGGGEEEEAQCFRRARRGGEPYGDEAAEDIRRQRRHRTQRQDYEAYYEGEEAEAEAAADARGHLEPRIHGESYGDEATEDIRRQRGHRTQQHGYGERYGGEEAEYAADARGHRGHRIHGESYGDEALADAEEQQQQQQQKGDLLQVGNAVRERTRRRDGSGHQSTGGREERGGHGGSERGLPNEADPSAVLPGESPKREASRSLQEQRQQRKELRQQERLQQLQGGLPAQDPLYHHHQQQPLQQQQQQQGPPLFLPPPKHSMSLSPPHPQRRLAADPYSPISPPAAANTDEAGCQYQHPLDPAALRRTEGISSSTAAHMDRHMDHHTNGHMDRHTEGLTARHVESEGHMGDRHTEGRMARHTESEGPTGRHTEDHMDRRHTREKNPSRHRPADGTSAAEPGSVSRDKDPARLVEENARLLEWNAELQEELALLSEGLKKRGGAGGGRDDGRLERKLWEKGQLCERLRQRVRELADREAQQRGAFEEEVAKLTGALEVANQQSDRQLGHTVGTGEADHNLVAEIANLRLLEEERLQEIEDLTRQLAERDREIERVTAEKQSTEDRVARLQDTVQSLAAGISEIQQQQVEAEHLRCEMQDRERGFEAERAERDAAEADLLAAVETLRRQVCEAEDDAREWKRQYHELRSSLPAQADDADEHYAAQHHAVCHEVALSVSDVIHLQSVVRCHTARQSL